MSWIGCVIMCMYRHKMMVEYMEMEVTIESNFYLLNASFLQSEEVNTPGKAATGRFSTGE
jgi:hypothetical protein